MLLCGSRPSSSVVACRCVHSTQTLYKHVADALHSNSLPASEPKSKGRKRAQQSQKLDKTLAEHSEQSLTHLSTGEFLQKLNAKMMPHTSYINRGATLNHCGAVPLILNTRVSDLSTTTQHNHVSINHVVSYKLKPKQSEKWSSLLHESKPTVQTDSVTANNNKKKRTRSIEWSHHFAEERANTSLVYEQLSRTTLVQFKTNLFYRTSLRQAYESNNRELMLKEMQNRFFTDCKLVYYGHNLSNQGSAFVDVRNRKLFEFQLRVSRHLMSSNLHKQLQFVHHSTIMTRIMQWAATFNIHSNTLLQDCKEHVQSETPSDSLHHHNLIDFQETAAQTIRSLIHRLEIDKNYKSINRSIDLTRDYLYSRTELDIIKLEYERLALIEKNHSTQSQTDHSTVDNYSNPLCVKLNEPISDQANFVYAANHNDPYFTKEVLLSKLNSQMEMELQPKISVASCVPFNTTKTKKPLKTTKYASILTGVCERVLSMPSEQAITHNELVWDITGALVLEWYKDEIKHLPVKQSVRSVCSEYYRMFCEVDVAHKWRYNHRQYWRKSCESTCEVDAVQLIDSWFDLDQSTLMFSRLGSYLADMLVEHLKYGDQADKMKKVFRRVRDYQRTSTTTGAGGNREYKATKAHIQPNKTLAKQFQGIGELYFCPTSLPMVAPPQPWINVRTGGMYLRGSMLVRIRTAYRKWMGPQIIESRLETANQLDAVFDSLNQLASVPWKVNTQILDVMLALFKSVSEKDCAHSMQMVAAKLKIPRASAVHMGWKTMPKIERVRHKLGQVLSVEEKNKERALYKEMRKNKQKYNELHSLWITMLYRLSIADHFRNKTLWFAQSLDFRGRVYPMSPHFNHIGSDVSRGLLTFEIGRPLGEDGFDWLLIHAVNLTGKVKKMSMTDRLKEARRQLPFMIESANQPMRGDLSEKFWYQSEEPWQTLAVCFEIRDALNSGDPSTFVSHLPVHQDGSCNGYQHYAALGRDIEGAKGVNLLPCDQPQDVYDRIRQNVEKIRLENLACDDEELQRMAELSEPYIIRKMVKRPVMTQVYGVTLRGAANHIKDDISEKFVDEDGKDKHDSKELNHICFYLARTIFAAVKLSFHSSRGIMEYFRKCTQLVTGPSISRTMEWQTPLGLPVVQPYMTEKSMNLVNDPNQVISDSLDVVVPYSNKQRNAMPANYVHSLDSTHMMLTALHCAHNGVLFASVHDCFWTHACDVPVMNRITRDTFVHLHKQPLLQQLRDSFLHRYLNDELMKKVPVEKRKEIEQAFKALPETGHLNIEDVKDSVYFFS